MQFFHIQVGKIMIKLKFEKKLNREKKKYIKKFY